jgi:hypothetical protein
VGNDRSKRADRLGRSRGEIFELDRFPN